MKKLIVLYWLQIFILSAKEKALVISPVVNLTGDPLKKTKFYNFPLAPVEWKDNYSCRRIHQLLFNEIVEILEETTNEVLISITNAFLEAPKYTTKQTRFWALKSNFRKLKDLEKIALDLNKIPKPINFQNDKKNEQEIIILTAPLLDKTTNKSYSAGTRFVATEDNAYIFDNTKNKFFKVQIPAKKFIKEKQRNSESSIKLFIQILENWAEQNFIPYVWGGCSFVNLCKEKFKEIQEIDQTNSKEKKYYEIPDCKEFSKTGLDCSGLILRAAQIAGIPYYFKNTTTISKNLDALAAGEKISDGDLILWPGHVIALTNCKDGTLVEAGGYSYGYGKVHKVTIDKFFKGVQNCSDLEKAYFKKQKLYRLDVDKNIIQVIPQFKIFKISSCWRKKREA